MATPTLTRREPLILNDAIYCSTWNDAFALGTMDARRRTTKRKLWDDPGHLWAYDLGWREVRECAPERA
jgi:hypothetical protein